MMIRYIMIYKTNAVFSLDAQPRKSGYVAGDMDICHVIQMIETCYTPSGIQV